MGPTKRKHEVVNGPPRKLCCCHLLPHPARGPRTLPLVQAPAAPKVSAGCQHTLALHTSKSSNCSSAREEGAGRGTVVRQVGQGQEGSLESSDEEMEEGDEWRPKASVYETQKRRSSQVMSFLAGLANP
eukprot:1145862-Pelagomonas_calceolata.AAC.1